MMETVYELGVTDHPVLYVPTSGSATYGPTSSGSPVVAQMAYVVDYNIRHYSGQHTSVSVELVVSSGEDLGALKLLLGSGYFPIGRPTGYHQLPAPRARGEPCPWCGVKQVEMIGKCRDCGGPL